MHVACRDLPDPDTHIAELHQNEALLLCAVPYDEDETQKFPQGGMKMQWYLDVWQNYLGFDGRASRTEYWMFTLFNALVVSALSILTALAHALVILTWLYCLAVLIPSLAVQVRRLHDIGRSGWWLLISLVPLVGAIVLLVFFVLPSEPGSNLYGPPPRIAL